MDEEPSSDPLRPRDGFFPARKERTVDFFRAYRCRMNTPEPRELISELQDDEELELLINRATRLIREYRITAKRVGVELDHALVGKVLEGLQRESLGDLQPTMEFYDVAPTERFLAESLYSEILELPLSGTVASTPWHRPRLTSERWRYCLEQLAESIETTL